jgi:hypothetical protein
MKEPRYRIEAQRLGGQHRMIDLKTGEIVPGISKIEITITPQDVPRVVVHFINVEVKI